MNNVIPFVSVIMPIRNEESFIRTSLKAVMCQDYPSSFFEVLVADGMSDDGTRGYIQSFQRQYSNLFLIDNPAKIIPNGFNLAFLQAKGEIIIRVDGHSEIASDYIRRCVDHLVRGEAEVVGGMMHTVGTTPTSRAIAIAMSSIFGVGGAFRSIRGQSRYVDGVAFAAHKRTMMDQAGPYDENMLCNEDDEYHYRLRKIGARILVANDAHVNYYSRSTMKALWHQYYRYGYWKPSVMLLHPFQMRPRHFVPVIFVLTLIALFFLSLFYTSYWLFFVLVLSAYFIGNLAASFCTSKIHGWQYFFVLPLIFAVIHFSYGTGFLLGSLISLVRYFNK